MSMPDGLPFFLTDLDANARTKGSRDPLGAQAIWTRMGRYIVGNLTTVSNAYRDFTVLMLGYYFAEKVAPNVGEGHELETFLKWEQVASYSRHHAGDHAFRGTEKVGRTLAHSSRVAISAARSFQTLSNQQLYGLWGLYSVPAAASGLLDQETLRLTSLAHEFVDATYRPILRAGGHDAENRIVSMLSREQSPFDVGGKDERLAAAIAKAIRGKAGQAERPFYWKALVEGGAADTTDGRQALMAQIFRDDVGKREEIWSAIFVRSLEKRAATQRNATGDGLAERLAAIRACESVLAPAVRIFAYVQGLHGQTLDQAAAAIKRGFGDRAASVNLDGFRSLKSELDAIRADAAERWIHIAEALHGGKYVDAVRLIIQQNAATMDNRGGMSWIEIKGNKLHVRMPGDERVNLDPQALRNLWRFPYFLDSLMAVAFDLAEHKP